MSQLDFVEQEIDLIAMDTTTLASDAVNLAFLQLRQQQHLLQRQLLHHKQHLKPHMAHMIWAI